MALDMIHHYFFIGCLHQLSTNHEIEYIEVKQTYLPCFLAGATDFQEGFLSVAPYLVHSSKARCHAYQELKMT